MIFFASSKPASIDCNIEQCSKPMNLYEELGCKATYSTQSCCAKRFDCPDFTQPDEEKCTFGGKQYQVGEILPRNITSNTKCVETCFCTRSGFFFCDDSFPFHSFSLLAADKTTSPPILSAQTAIAVSRALRCPAA
jgi:hypothetical protein